MRETRDTARVLAPPPVIFLGAIVVGEALEAVWPLGFFDLRWVRVVGVCFIAAGIAMSGSVVWHFSRAKTAVSPMRETTALVTSGPYRVSRNPDYVGQAVLAAGIGLVSAAPWVLLALVPAVLVVRYGVIAREERYLERLFGAEYERYRRQVRRWL